MVPLRNDEYFGLPRFMLSTLGPGSVCADSLVPRAKTIALRRYVLIDLDILLFRCHGFRISYTVAASPL